jgi:hypothetical protein
MKIDHKFGYRCLRTLRGDRSVPRSIKFAPLLGRGSTNVPDRLTELRSGEYLTLPDQPRTNNRYLIYQLGKARAAELHEEGVHFRTEPRALAHELGACLVAASFELGSVKHNLSMPLLPMPETEKRPDWPLFSIAGREVLIEFDTGSESLEVIERSLSKWSLKSQCTTGPERRIPRWEHEHLLEAVQHRLDANPQAMRVRRGTVEHPFGTMKARMGATHFLTKTLPKVAAEMALSVLAYNLTRAMNIVGTKPLMAAIAA